MIISAVFLLVEVFQHRLQEHGVLLSTKLQHGVWLLLAKCPAEEEFARLTDFISLEN